jgi:hypothetical protein
MHYYTLSRICMYFAAESERQRLRNTIGKRHAGNEFCMWFGSFIHADTLRFSEQTTTTLSEMKPSEGMILHKTMIHPSAIEPNLSPSPPACLPEVSSNNGSTSSPIYHRTHLTSMHGHLAVFASPNTALSQLAFTPTSLHRSSATMEIFF